MSRIHFKKGFKTLGAVIFAGVLLFWCFRQVDLRAFLSALDHALPLWLLIAAGSTLLIIALNSIQLKTFLPNYHLISFGRMFQLVSIFSMTVNLVPFWGGHALMIYLMGQREKVGKTVALSVVTLDQIIEGFAKIFIFAVVVFSGPFPDWMRGGMQGFLALVAISYGVLFFISFRFRNHLEEKPEAAYPRWKKLHHIFAKWAHHLHTLRNWKLMLFTVGLAIFMKFLEVSSVYFIQKSLGIPLGLSSAFLAVAALSLATTLPLTPGRLGLFEAGALLTYRYLGLSSSEALALGVLIHAAHTLPFVVAGILSSFNLGFRSKEIQEAPLESKTLGLQEPVETSN